MKSPKAKDEWTYIQASNVYIYMYVYIYSYIDIYGLELDRYASRYNVDKKAETKCQCWLDM